MEKSSRQGVASLARSTGGLSSALLEGGRRRSHKGTETRRRASTFAPRPRSILRSQSPNELPSLNRGASGVELASVPLCLRGSILLRPASLRVGGATPPPV